MRVRKNTGPYTSTILSRDEFEAPDNLVLHRCIYCVGHKTSKLIIEENESYYKSPKPRWVKCICPDCGHCGPSGYSDEEAIKNWNAFCQKEAAWGQTVLATFKRTHYGV